MKAEEFRDYMSKLHSEIEAKRKEEAMYQRKLRIGQWLIDNQRESITDISWDFMISRSQVWRDLDSLKYIDMEMYDQCRTILNRHKDGKYIQSKKRR